MKRVRLTKVDLGALALVVGVGVTAHFVGFEPIRRARADSLAQNALLSQRTAALDAKIELINTQKAARAKAQEKIATAIRLESPTTLNQRMAAIPELGAAAGVRVREVVPKAPQPGKRLTKVPITIGGDGPSTHLAHFLNQLHTTFPDMEVLTLSLSARPESPDEPARFSMDLVWYTRAGSDGSKGAPAEKFPPKP